MHRTAPATAEDDGREAQAANELVLQLRHGNRPLAELFSQPASILCSLSSLRFSQSDLGAFTLSPLTTWPALSDLPILWV